MLGADQRSADCSRVPCSSVGPTVGSFTIQREQVRGPGVLLRCNPQLVMADVPVARIWVTLGLWAAPLPEVSCSGSLVQPTLSPLDAIPECAVLRDNLPRFLHRTLLRLRRQLQPLGQGGTSWFGLSYAGLGWAGLRLVWGGVSWNGVGWGAMGWDGMGWDGMGWAGVGWGGGGWGGLGWDGRGRATAGGVR